MTVCAPNEESLHLRYGVNIIQTIDRVFSARRLQLQPTLPEVGDSLKNLLERHVEALAAQNADVTSRAQVLLDGEGDVAADVLLVA